MTSHVKSIAKSLSNICRIFNTDKLLVINGQLHPAAMSHDNLPQGRPYSISIGHRSASGTHSLPLMLNDTLTSGPRVRYAS